MLGEWAQVLLRVASRTSVFWTACVGNSVLTSNLKRRVVVAAWTKTLAMITNNVNGKMASDLIEHESFDKLGSRDVFDIRFHPCVEVKVNDDDQSFDP